MVNNFLRISSLIHPSKKTPHLKYLSLRGSKWLNVSKTGICVQKSCWDCWNTDVIANSSLNTISVFTKVICTYNYNIKYQLLSWNHYQLTIALTSSIELKHSCYGKHSWKSFILLMNTFFTIHHTAKYYQIVAKVWILKLSELIWLSNYIICVAVWLNFRRKLMRTAKKGEGLHWNIKTRRKDIKTNGIAI